jgi:hypothetical protein
MHRKSELPQNLPQHQLGNKECRKAATVVRYLYQMEYGTKLDLTLNQTSPSSSIVLLPIVVSPNFSAATSSAILAPLSAAVGIPNECWMSSVKREILLSWNASPYTRYAISTNTKHYFHTQRQRTLMSDIALALEPSLPLRSVHTLPTN